MSYLDFPSPSLLFVFLHCPRAAGRGCFSLGKGGTHTSCCKGEEQWLLVSCICHLVSHDRSWEVKACMGVGDTDNVTSSLVISNSYVII